MPTFGRTNTGNSDLAIGFASYWKQASKFTLGEDGQVTKISIYFGVNPNREIEAVIYDDDGTGENAGTKLASKSQTVNATGWVDFTLDSPLNLSAGSYWLTICSASDTMYNCRYQTGTGSLDRQNDTPPASDPWGAHSIITGELCIYATYTPAAPPAAGGETGFYFVLAKGWI